MLPYNRLEPFFLTKLETHEYKTNVQLFPEQKSWPEEWGRKKKCVLMITVPANVDANTTVTSCIPLITPVPSAPTFRTAFACNRRHISNRMPFAFFFFPDRYFSCEEHAYWRPVRGSEGSPTHSEKSKTLHERSNLLVGVCKCVQFLHRATR